MRVLAADRYILCCGLIRTLMQLYDDVCITPANNIDEVMARLPELPDLALVLLDTGMPGMEGFAGLKRTVEHLPHVPVILTSSSECPDDIMAAVHNGARGYVSPSSKLCVLRHALPLVLSGGFYIIPAIALRPESGQVRLPAERQSPQNTLSAGDNLTPRQHEIVRLLAEGKSNKEIARELDLLEGTVKLHVAAILRRLGVRNRTEAALAVIGNGYLPKRTLSPEPPMLECTTGEVDYMASGASMSSPPLQSRATDIEPPNRSVTACATTAADRAAALPNPRKPRHALAGSGQSRA